MNEPLLNLHDIHVHYGGVKALNGASVAIDEGEVVALMGPNGAGKSTVLKAIFGLAPIESGTVAWEKQEFKPVSHEVVHRGISFVPQGRRVFRHLTVAENLEIGGWAVADKTTR
ncbi:ATP-binding cassette domain-containing protein, partial [bacterium]|nr:ATP-binding cassette domain-containing protein [bacterium]